MTLHERLETMSDRPGLSLRQNFVWTASSNAIYSGCQWGIIASLAKYGSAELVGMFAFGLAIATPIQMFFQMQLRGVQSTDARNEYRFQEYLSLRIATSIVAVLVFASVLFWGKYGHTKATVVALIALAKTIDSITDVFLGAFQHIERMDIVGKSFIINGISSLILFAAGLLVADNMIVGIIGYVLGSVIALVGYVVPNARTHISERLLWNDIQLSRIMQLLRLALPLGFVMLLVTLNASIPRYVIEYRLGSYELGIFAALTYIIVVGNTLMNALGQTASPRLARYHAEGKFAEFRSMLVKMMISGLVLGGIGALLARFIGNRILTLLYTEEYASYVNLLVLLSLTAGITFAASFAGYGLTATRTFGLQVPLFIAVVLVSVLASLWLIPIYGLMGAGLSLSIAAVTQLALSVSLIYRTQSITGEA